METYIIAITGKEEKVGKRLQKLVKEKDYNNLGKVLNKIKVPKGATLRIQPYSEEDTHSLGGESHAIITLSDGQVISDNSKEFWKMLQVEDSPEGAWQVYLLHNLWHYLPLFWHANYEKRTYIYSNDQLKIASRYFPDFGQEEDVLTDFNPDKYEIYPVIWMDSGIWHVGAHFWSDFEGLVYEELKIKLEGGVHVYSRPVSHRALYRYNVGICF